MAAMIGISNIAYGREILQGFDELSSFTIENNQVEFRDGVDLVDFFKLNSEPETIQQELASLEESFVAMIVRVDQKMAFLITNEEIFGYTYEDLDWDNSDEVEEKLAELDERFESEKDGRLFSILYDPDL